jgi:hypothetical protein
VIGGVEQHHADPISPAAKFGSAVLKLAANRREHSRITQIVRDLVALAAHRIHNPHHVRATGIPTVADDLRTGLSAHLHVGTRRARCIEGINRVSQCCRRRGQHQSKHQSFLHHNLQFVSGDQSASLHSFFSFG